MAESQNTIIDRFWKYVSPEPMSGCWLWLGGMSAQGYASFFAGAATMGGHRFAYQLVHGAIPRGLVIDHLCRVRCCVNPDHLEAITMSINVIRGIGPEVASKRQRAISRCPNGHPYDAINTLISHLGARKCKICYLSNLAKFNKRRRDARAYGRAYKPTTEAGPSRYVVTGEHGAMGLSTTGPGLYFCCGKTSSQYATEFSSRQSAHKAIRATLRRAEKSGYEPPAMAIYRLAPRNAQQYEPEMQVEGGREG